MFPSTRFWGPKFVVSPLKVLVIVAVLPLAMFVTPSVEYTWISWRFMHPTAGLAILTYRPVVMDAVGVEASKWSVKPPHMKVGKTIRKTTMIAAAMSAFDILIRFYNTLI